MLRKLGEHKGIFSLEILQSLFVFFLALLLLLGSAVRLKSSLAEAFNTISIQQSAHNAAWKLGSFYRNACSEGAPGSSGHGM